MVIVSSFQLLDVDLKHLFWIILLSRLVFILTIISITGPPLYLRNPLLCMLGIFKPPLSQRLLRNHHCPSIFDALAALSALFLINRKGRTKKKPQSQFLSGDPVASPRLRCSALTPHSNLSGEMYGNPARMLSVVISHFGHDHPRCFYEPISNIFFYQ